MTLTPTETPQLSLVHRVRRPAGAPSERHPTVIALHGRGSNEADLPALAPYLDDRLLWISPRAPLDLEGGYEWYRVPAIGRPDPQTLWGALVALNRFIDEALRAYPIDARRLYLFGFSQGSMLSLAYALVHPERVAGVLAHSGYLPLEALQSGRVIDPAGARGKPVIMVHGTQDRTILVSAARSSRDILAAAGVDLQYHEFPIGHNVSDRSLAVLDEWLRGQLDKEAT